MNEKNNEKKKNHNRHHGRNHNRGRNNEQKKAKAPQEQLPEIVLPEFDFIAPEPKKEEPKGVNTDDIVLSDEVLAKIDEDIIPPIDRVVEHLEKEKPIVDETEMTDIIGIRFKKTGKVYYFDPNGCVAKRGEHAIVDTARGPEFGEVWIPNRKVPNSEIVPPLRPCLRIATKEDIKHNAENQVKEEEAFKICNEKIENHKLDMKLVDVQYTFDNSKLLFYFTSAGRVDFRELVKDLASVFRTRIELRQIGIRDEAKLIGGLGICGRKLCCAGFLTDFGQVSIKMAKEQSLSLNSTKISGNCGRLMCCLRYEQKTYEQEIRLTPPVDAVVKTDDGIGTVCEISPLLGMIKVKFEGVDGAPKAYHRDNVQIVSVPNKKASEEDTEN